jgi:hypothetical protein
LARETEVLEENLSQCHFIYHKPHMLCPEANPGRRGGKPATNSLNHGTAKHGDISFLLNNFIISIREHEVDRILYNTVLS